MTTNRFFAPLVLAAGLALTAAPALMPAAAQAQTVIASDPARLRAVEGIMTNLKLYEVMVHMGQKTLVESPDAANYTPAQKAQLAQYFADAMAKRRTVLIHKLAVGTRGDYSMDQLNNLLALSKVKYVQDLVAQGADPSQFADASSMTVADQNLVQAVGNQPYVGDFFTKAIDYDVIKDDIVAATLETYKAFGNANGSTQ
jgi:hypothetical protein